MEQKNLPELMQWQWEGYHLYHASRFNLMAHIIFVPLFVWANVGMIASLLNRNGMGALAGLVLMALSFAVQAVGHKNETVASVPFGSVGNAFKRVFIEQWVTFPKFVVSGGWWKALNNAK